MEKNRYRKGGKYFGEGKIGADGGVKGSTKKVPAEIRMSTLSVTATVI